MYKFKEKITGKTENVTRKDVEIMVPLKYLSNFWRSLEMPLINFEINNVLTWSENCFIAVFVVGVQVPLFAIADIKFR